MRTLKFKQITLLAAALILIAPLLYFSSGKVEAAQLLNRRLRLGDPEAGATSSYRFSFDIQSLVSIGSFEFEFCSNDPLPGEPCTPPTGFDASAATLFNQSGETGFSIHANSTANRIVLSRTPAVATASNLVYRFENIVNPSTPQQTNYVRLASFASDDGTGPRIDDGGIAFVTSDRLSLNLYVPPYLSFCVALNVSGFDCLTATGNRINFGQLSPTQTRTDTSELVITTNAANGYNISVTGPTMTSGIYTIDGLSSATPSIVGTEQFGLNLRSNSSPAVGSNPTGLRNGSPTSKYNQINNFAYANGDTVVSSNKADATSYTASYIVNIPSDQEPGVYTTTLTYIAFATF